jgi:hypothetical protein
MMARPPSSRRCLGVILLVVPDSPDAANEVAGRRVPVRLRPWLGGQ